MIMSHQNYLDLLENKSILFLNLMSNFMKIFFLYIINFFNLNNNIPNFHYFSNTV